MGSKDGLLYPKCPYVQKKSIPQQELYNRYRWAIHSNGNINRNFIWNKTLASRRSRRTAVKQHRGFIFAYWVKTQWPNDGVNVKETPTRRLIGCDPARDFGALSPVDFGYVGCVPHISRRIFAF